MSAIAEDLRTRIDRLSAEEQSTTGNPLESGLDDSQLGTRKAWQACVESQKNFEASFHDYKVHIERLNVVRKCIMIFLDDNLLPLAILRDSIVQNAAQKLDEYLFILFLFFFLIHIIVPLGGLPYVKTLLYMYAT